MHICVHVYTCTYIYREKLNRCRSSFPLHCNRMVILPRALSVSEDLARCAGALMQTCHSSMTERAHPRVPI